MSHKKRKIRESDAYSYNSFCDEEKFTKQNIQAGYNYFATLGLKNDSATLGNPSLFLEKFHHQHSFLLKNLPTPQQRATRSFPELCYPNPEEKEQFFRGLAINEPLETLTSNIPHGYKNEGIIHVMWQYRVPIVRATWFIKIVQLNLTKRHKGSDGKRKVRDDWTVIIRDYLKRLLDELCPNVPKNPSQEVVMKWEYVSQLAYFQFKENLLNRVILLSWLIDSVAMIAGIGQKGATSRTTSTSSDLRIYFLFPFCSLFLPEIVQQRQLSFKLVRSCDAFLNKKWAKQMKVMDRKPKGQILQIAKSVSDFILLAVPCSHFWKRELTTLKVTEGAKQHIQNVSKLISLLDEFYKDGDVSEIVPQLAPSHDNEIINVAGLTTLFEWGITNQRSYIPHRLICTLAVIKEIVEDYNLQEDNEDMIFDKEESQDSFQNILIECLHQLNPDDRSEFREVYRIFSRLISLKIFDFELYLEWLHESRILDFDNKLTWEYERHKNYLMNFQSLSPQASLARHHMTADAPTGEIGVEQETRLRFLALEAVVDHLNICSSNKFSRFLHNSENDLTEFYKVPDNSKLKWSHEDVELFSGTHKWIDFSNALNTDVLSLLEALPFCIGSEIILRITKLVIRFMEKVKQGSQNQSFIASSHLQNYSNLLSITLGLLESLQFSELLSHILLTLIPCELFIPGLLCPVIVRHFTLFTSLDKVEEIKTKCIGVMRAMKSARDAEIWLVNAKFPESFKEDLNSKVLHTWAERSNTNSQPNKRTRDLKLVQADSDKALHQYFNDTKQNIDELIRQLDENIYNNQSAYLVFGLVITHILKICLTCKSTEKLGKHFAQATFIVRQMIAISDRLGHRRVNFGIYLLNLLNSEVFGELCKTTHSSESKYIRSPVTEDKMALIQKRFLCFLVFLIRDGFICVEDLCLKLLEPIIRGTKYIHSQEMVAKGRLCMSLICILTGVRDQEVFRTCGSINLSLLEIIVYSHTKNLQRLFTLLESLYKISGSSKNEKNSGLCLTKDALFCLHSMFQSHPFRSLCFLDSRKLYVQHLSKGTEICQSTELYCHITENINSSSSRSLYSLESLATSGDRGAPYIMTILRDLTPWNLHLSWVHVRLELDRYSSNQRPNSTSNPQASNVDLVEFVTSILLKCTVSKKADSETPNSDSDTDEEVLSQEPRPNSGPESILSPPLAVSLIEYLGESIGSEVIKVVQQELDRECQEFIPTVPNSPMTPPNTVPNTNYHSDLNGLSGEEDLFSQLLHFQEQQSCRGGTASAGRGTQDIWSTSTPPAIVIGVLSKCKGLEDQKKEFIDSVVEQLQSIAETLVRSHALLSDAHLCMKFQRLILHRIECLQHLSDAVLQNRCRWNIILAKILETLINLLAEPILHSDQGTGVLSAAIYFLETLLEGLSWYDGRQMLTPAPPQKRKMLYTGDNIILSNVERQIQNLTFPSDVRRVILCALPSYTHTGNIQDATVAVSTDFKSSHFSSQSSSNGSSPNRNPKRTTRVMDPWDLIECVHETPIQEFLLNKSTSQSYSHSHSSAHSSSSSSYRHSPKINNSRELQSQPHRSSPHRSHPQRSPTHQRGHYPQRSPTSHSRYPDRSPTSHSRYPDRSPHPRYPTRSPHYRSNSNGFQG